MNHKLSSSTMLEGIANNYQGQWTDVVLASVASIFSYKDDAVVGLAKHVSRRKLMSVMSCAVILIGHVN